MLGWSFQPKKIISPFFSLYVGYVPASDDLGICCFVWRSEFSLKFLFVTEEKSTFCRKAPDLPKQNKFWEIPKWFTKTFHSWVLPQYCWVCLFRYKELTIHLPLVSITANLSTPWTTALQRQDERWAGANWSVIDAAAVAAVGAVTAATARQRWWQQQWRQQQRWWAQTTINSKRQRKKQRRLRRQRQRRQQCWGLYAGHDY
jgi:hypothetical protein